MTTSIDTFHTFDTFDTPDVLANVSADVTRREFVVGGAAFAALVSALGSGGAARAGTTPEDTVEVTDVLGTRPLPASPQRVVCLDGSLDLDLAALCGFPVLAYYDRSTETVPLPGLMREAAADAETLPFEPSLEQLAALGPDLIITESTYWLDEIGRDRFEQIAPILVTQRTPESRQWEWREEFAYFADAFGRGNEIEAAYARYDDAVAALRAEHADVIASTRLSVVQFNNGTGDIVLHPPTNVLVGYVVDELGGRFAESQDDLDAPLVMAPESLAEVDGDLLIRVAYDLTDDAFDGLEAKPLWPALPAVADGAVFDTAVLVTNFGGPSVALRCVEMLAEAYGSIA